MSGNTTQADDPALERELRDFRAGLTPFAMLDAGSEGEGALEAAVGEVSRIIKHAVQGLLANQAINDLRKALARIASMQQVYGQPVYNWTNERRPIEFSRMLGRSPFTALNDEQIADYEARLALLRYDLVETRFALRLETDLLPTYARWQGRGEASLLSAEEGSGETIALLAEDTASLMLWRMLTIRWCEDHGMFAARYMTGVGIALFWQFAEYFGKPAQELLRQSNRHGRTVFPQVFAPSPLDWALMHNDVGLSAALERTIYQLSRWNFAALGADTLWDLCDGHLAASDRQPRVPQMNSSALTLASQAVTPRA